MATSGDFEMAIDTFCPRSGNTDGSDPTAHGEFIVEQGSHTFTNRHPTRTVDRAFRSLTTSCATPHTGQVVFTTPRRA
jgi:hypothetical protein